MMAAIVEDLVQGTPQSRISNRFHATVADMVVSLCQSVRKRTGIEQVALSGGVFQNRLLLKQVVPLLEAARFMVLTHKQVPCNDGGISLGQAIIAATHSM
jgi:hydrogenase maturation protein HypF